jgi:hypothetical protein
MSEFALQAEDLRCRCLVVFCVQPTFQQRFPRHPRCEGAIFKLMNAPIPSDACTESNPMADSWEPADKAMEAAIENPEEFDVNHPATEDSLGPVPSGRPKTHGEAESAES